MRCQAEVTQLTSNGSYFNIFKEKELGFGALGVWACASPMVGGPAILVRPWPSSPAFVGFIQFDVPQYLHEWIKDNPGADILWRSDSALASPRGEKEEE